MKRAVVWTLAVAFAAGSALATDVNLSVESGGSNAIVVGAGEQVNYQVVAELSDALNEGLALIGFDLEFDGGALAQADVPTSGNMTAFVCPEGINNPPCATGYGGTVVGSVLKQVGGGQNTINNDIGNAPFPIGVPILGIAQPGSPQVVATGSLTAPAVEGTYHLVLSGAFANVVRDGETGNPPAPHNFWKTDPAGVGTVINLDITVGAGGTCTIVDSTPPACAIDGRQPHPVGDAGTPQGWSSIELVFNCTGAAVPSANAADYGLSDATLNITNVNVVGLTATVTFDRVITPGIWTCIDYQGGDKTCLGVLPADVNSDHVSTPSDILVVIDCINGVATIPCDIWQVDADREGGLQPPDILRVIDLLNGAGAFDPWFNVSLPVQPECPVP